MSSATSTEAPGASASIESSSPAARASGGGTRSASEKGDSGLEPWQFFVLAALGCATAMLFAIRGRGLTAVVLLSILMAAAALAGLATLRTVRPLVSPDDDRTSMIGQRSRVALEREKLLALRAIKELEFDHAMGKLSEADWHEMSSRLRTRAARLIRQLDAGAGYRQQIERDLAKRLEYPSPDSTNGLRARDAESAPGSVEERTVRMESAVCASCRTPNDLDARFCKNCGKKL